MQTTFQFINLDYLDIMCGGDEDMKKHMLVLLLQEFPEEIKLQKKYFDENNYKELSNISHKLKSTLSFVGYDLLTDANKEVERISKNNVDIELLSGFMQKINTYFQQVLPELEQAYKE